jgi:adenine-specific DNA-methyltransferase
MPTLNWIGKEAVINHHLEVPFRLLKDVPELSCGDPGSGNLIVEGDNLVALKALLPYYKGKVKCICIDPPYNTGNEGWAYNDNVNSPAIKKWLGETVGKEGETLDRHDRWLCMMYPRLALLREFLREDGCIFVCLDDNEIHALRFVMDEVFGANNFIECITWNKRIPKNDAGIGNIHEYVMIYRKSAAWDYRLTMKKEGLEKVDELIEKFQLHRPPISEAEEALKQLYKEGGYDRGVTLYNCLDENYRPWGKINMSWPNANTFGPRYEVPHPLTGKPVKIPDRGWRWKEETFKAHLAKGPKYERHDGSVVVGRIWFAKDENTQPSSITYLDEVNRILLRSVLSLKSDGGMELEQLFVAKSTFAYPKPTSLIEILVDSLQMENGDIVLDSFAGSGTTAEVVLRLNKRDQIKRRFVLV